MPVYLCIGFNKHSENHIYLCLSGRRHCRCLLTARWLRGQIQQMHPAVKSILPIFHASARPLPATTRSPGRQQRPATGKTEQQARTSEPAQEILVTRLAATIEDKMTTFILFPTLPRLMATVGGRGIYSTCPATWLPGALRGRSAHSTWRDYLQARIIVFVSLSLPLLKYTFVDSRIGVSRTTALLKVLG